MYLEETMWLPWGSEGGGQPVLNNIIWQNEIYMSEYVWPEEYDIRFNNIQGGWEGEGNIDTDPLFADPANSDYHLKSQAGRWDPTSKSWVQDGATSPCIDAGDPSSDWDAELWPHGKRINMGAYGSTLQASMSLSTAGNAADSNNDDVVDVKDLVLLTDRWLADEVLLPEDINRDGLVNFPDFAELAQSWLWQQ